MQNTPFSPLLLCCAGDSRGHSRATRLGKCAVLLGWVPRPTSPAGFFDFVRAEAG